MRTSAEKRREAEATRRNRSYGYGRRSLAERANVPKIHAAQHINILTEAISAALRRGTQTCSTVVLRYDDLG